MKTDNESPKYLDCGIPVDERVEDLLGRMTPEEKIREMSMCSLRHLVENGAFSKERAGRYFGGMGFGCMEDPRQDPKKTAEICNEMQRYLRENTRLGIPSMVTCECLHGFMSPGATVFPQAISLAGTFNRALVRQVSGAIAKEARSCGMAQALTPVLDVARDPRWGRTEETYGEDPYLCGAIGTEFIKGLQGEGPGIDGEHVAATAKHFAAYGNTEGGLNMAPSHVGERELRSVFLTPFKKAVEAGVTAVMPAYCEIDGVPCHGSSFLLRRVLREEWGFTGYVFSDFEGIKDLHGFHHTAGSKGEAGKQALAAGVDFEAPCPYGFTEEFAEMVKTGEVDMKLIDRAVSNILRAKFLTGIFDRPFADPEKAAAVVNCGEHKSLSRKAARESIVLLKNDGRLLPLGKNLRTVAVIGPNAGKMELGGYSMEKADAVSVLQGIREKVSKNTEVLYAAGCEICGDSRRGFEEAVEAAKRADVAVAVVGECSLMQRGMGWGSNLDDISISGEGFDRCELGLPGVQEELVAAVRATGTPVVMVLVNGRPLSIDRLAKDIPAIVEAWYPGEEGGRALADILFGDVNPSGKLAISFPKSAGQIPQFYNHKPSARGYYHKPGTPEKPGRDYVFGDAKPLFEFGFGLSFTTFEYSNLRVIPEKIGRGGYAAVCVDVENTGPADGMEAVLMYVNDVVSSVTTPVRELKGFEKINLAKSEKKRVSFMLRPEDLALVDSGFNEVVEPGLFEITISGLKKSLEVL
jgi:beta-glucosidase